MRNFKVDGIVIKRNNYGEADRLLTLFTRQFGKMKVKASGVRKITSRRSSHIELLNYASLTLFQGRKYPVLTEVATIHSFDGVKNNLRKIGYSYHLCELIDGLCAENQENDRVFGLLQKTLLRLEKSEDTKTLVDEFEIELLTILGFWNRSFVHQQLDTHQFIENILERRLRSKRIFAKIS
ncbi:MAG TPA: DNA repair protein RecO [Patescibacteria group bacterium]|nr:DNA repair protein RecO [Patescibacteria group bacterium]